MDPNALLKRMLVLCEAGAQRTLDDGEQSELVHGVRDLDHWLHSGGFWPERWSGRGVNLQMANKSGALDAAIVRLQQAGRGLVVHTGKIELVIATPHEPENDGRLVAALATHTAYAASPVDAVLGLVTQLEEQRREPVGSS